MYVATIQDDEKLMRLAKKCMFFTLIAHLIAAFFSIGYIHWDEHFQILEFADYKLGFAPAKDLPWEFEAQIRPALQPAFVVFIAKCFGSHFDPICIAFLLRLFSSLLGLGSLVLTVIIGLKWLPTYEAKRFLILCSTFLWFFPFLHSHFSAESISGSLFFLGTGCIILAHDKHKNNLIFLGGFLLGLAFVVRPQTAFMILGPAIWCIFIARFSILKLSMILLTLLVAIGIGVLLDHWFYGEWLFTYWNYYKVNILMGKAASFGVLPWWEYFIWVGNELIFPFSIILIAGVLYSFYKYPKNIIVLSFIPFLLIHLIIGHKEARFLFPLANGIPVLLALAYSQVQNIFKLGKKYWRWLFILFWGINIIYLSVSCIKPASPNVQPYAYLYHHYNGKAATLLSFQGNPYVDIWIYLNYYKPAGIKIYQDVKNTQVDSFAKAIKGPLLVFTNNKTLDAEFIKSHPNVKLVYRSMPMWLDYFNFNNWISRSTMYKVYQMKP